MWPNVVAFYKMVAIHALIVGGMIVGFGLLVAWLVVVFIQ